VSVSENTSQPLDYELLKAAANSAAALRCRRRLQPAGGEGDKVFPPTYAGAVYSVEERRVRNDKGEWNSVTCVLLDSVQSQANRMEEALQEAIDDGALSVPLIVVDFAAETARKGLKDPILDRVTSLSVPHRLADAMLRDSIEVKTGKMFREGAHAARWKLASNANATAVFELCPTALVYGLWGSPEKPGGLGAKFERAIVSEVMAIGCPDWLLDTPWKPQRYGLKSSPVPVSSGAAVVADKHAETGWRLTSDAKAKGALRPSEINHGNVTYPSPGKPSPNVGITADAIEQTVTLSLIALRRLRFPKDEKSPATSAANTAARTLLAALGLCSATLAFAPGMDLRSRCVLFPDGPMEWDLLDQPGEEPKKYALDKSLAIKLLNDAIKGAKEAGLPWNTDPILLTPSKALVELVRKSQELAVSDSTDA